MTPLEETPMTTVALKPETIRAYCIAIGDTVWVNNTTTPAEKTAVMTRGETNGNDPTTVITHNEMHDKDPTTDTVTT